jgi:hypothetical protein
VTAGTATVDPSIERSVRRYGRLLALYPKDFRAEYGDDLLQSYRDLLHFGAERGGLSWRTTKDLVSSAARQRAQALSDAPRPSMGITIVIVVALALAALLGPGGGFGLLPVPAMVLIVLPVYGLSRFRKAWIVWRTTGGPVGRHLLLGAACFAPLAWFVASFGDEAGYFVFLAVFATLIVTAAVGIIWAVVSLSSGAGSGGSRRWLKPVLILVPCVAVLGVIIGASVNSYYNSLGPPGDHSVENASADTRALWVAARAGDLGEVRQIISETCADPWVKFPYGNGRHNAKGMAETRGLEGWTGPFGQISDTLGDYMDDWYDRCGRGRG